MRISKEDPWLYPGCICELFGNTDRVVAIFEEYDSEYDRLLFKNNKDWYEISLIDPKGYYKPIGTPWDYFTSDIKKIKIGCTGYVSAIDDNLQSVYWINCPDHLLDGIFERPEWAKDRL